MIRKRILCCCDSFKDSATADKINNALVRSAKELHPNFQVSKLNLTDGGEGFVDSLKDTLKCVQRTIPVTGPNHKIQSGVYAYSEKHKFAIIEMAAASGLESLPLSERNPLETTSKGTGELILDAIKLGCVKILLGIGGSATNDGGLGALQVLGLKAYTKDGLLETAVCGKHLDKIVRLNWDENIIKKFKHNNGLKIDIACDVDNPFIGEFGAVSIYSEQKGATPEIKRVLESGMKNISSLILNLSGVKLNETKGAGAAGGMGGGFHAILGANLLMGVEVVSQYLNLEVKIKESDLILTGEGCYDSQTSQGKIVSHVKFLAEKHKIPCVIVCGENRLENSNADDGKVFDLVSHFDLKNCMENTEECIELLLKKENKRIFGQTLI